ncbi:type II toxin-antitoxin system HicB family antitoxin [uncultured Selenomonas sp.]|uniref:type II toxin-antitoxin system HicB family antitoxin n=1 Tax=uncultured Selenomonas sp. TaxID=159275 RepID=UPI0025DED15E|nr:type II toxin-antitoxin system HicB family antitoxin [uncultured Selenomonas sp.]
MKHYYPAVFETAQEGGYTVTVPDIDGCFTEGKTLEQAMWMAQDAIGCMLEDVAEVDYPKASKVNDIDTAEYADCFVTLVEFDRQVYEQRCRDVALAREQIKALA